MSIRRPNFPSKLLDSARASTPKLTPEIRNEFDAALRTTKSQRAYVLFDVALLREMIFPNSALISRVSHRFSATFPPPFKFRSKGNKGNRVFGVVNWRWWWHIVSGVGSCGWWFNWLVVGINKAHTQYTQTPGGWWKLGG